MTGYEIIFAVVAMLISGAFALGGIKLGHHLLSADRKATEAETIQSLRRTQAGILFQEIEAYRSYVTMLAVHYTQMALALEMNKEMPDTPKMGAISYARIKFITLMYFPELKPIISKFEVERKQTGDRLIEIMKEVMDKPDGVKSFAVANAASMQMGFNLATDLELALEKEIEGLLPENMKSS